MNDYSRIDVEKLRKAVEEEMSAAYFAGGYGAALVESLDIKNASPEEVFEAAERLGISI
ncbi:hypothetical protein [Butyrivibrio fibrisolvens]|uniref:hypothetical protein n=1 Tax=Butyrivibrio fibrisolvens TaxID=831 RepID=UPI0012BCAC9D|nr:hypothetical protein [Butyrivibrio fibrisolvens]